MNALNKRNARPVFVLLTTIALLGGHENVRAQSAAEPLTLEQVERLVKSGVTNNRIISLAARNKLAFRVDSRAEGRLRSAGADDELVEALRGIMVVEPDRTGTGRTQGDEPEDRDGVGDAASSPGDSVPTTKPQRPPLTATGGALLSVPFPGIPLMSRESPGPLIGLGIIGALGYLAWDLHAFHKDREALREWDGVGEAPLDMTVEDADSVYDAKATTLVGAYVAQIFLTYFLWDELTPDPATIQPFMVADPWARRLSAGVRVPLPNRSTPRLSRRPAVREPSAAFGGSPENGSKSLACP